MTNAQIVMNLKDAMGIPEIVPMLTYGEWKRNGYQVKKGEHGTKVVLWKHLDNKSRKNSEPAADEDGEAKDGYTHKICYLFLPNQVEKIN